MPQQTLRRVGLIALVAFFSFASFDVQNADARGFGWFRGRSAYSQQKSTRQPTYRKTYQAPTRVYRQPTSRSYSSGRTQWPGAIGTPSPNYRFFQDINGYWN